MPNIRSNYATGKLPSKVAQGAEIVALNYEIDVPATGDGTVANDTLEMGVLPAGHVPVDVIYSADDLDSNGTPTHALSFGVLNAAKTDLSTAAADGGAVWASGLTIGQAATLARQSAKAIVDVAAAESDRNLAYKVTTASATKVAGKLRVTVLARTVP